MGGFLSALGNITAGAGEAAGEYSKQQRDLFHQTKMEGLRQMLDLINKHTPDSAEFQTGAGLINKVANAQPGDENNHTLLGQFMKWVHPHPNTIQAMQQAGVPGAGPAPPPTKAPAGPAAVGTQPGAAQFNFNGEPYLKPSPGGVTAGGAAQPGSNPLTSPPAPASIPPVNDPGSTATMQVSPGGPMTMAPPAAPPAVAQQPIESYDDWARAHLPADLRPHYGGNSDIYNSRIHQELEKYTPQRSEMERLKAMNDYQRDVAGPADIAAMKKLGIWDGLDPSVQGAAGYGALTGRNLPMLPVAAYREQTHTVQAEDLSPEAREGYGIPPGATGPYLVYTDVRTHQATRNADPAGSPTSLGLDDQNHPFAFARRPVGAIIAPNGRNAVPNTFGTPRNAGVGPGGHPLFQSMNDMYWNRPAVAGQGQVASTLPSTTTGPRSIQTVDKEGHPITKLVDVSTTRTRSVPGPAPVAGAPANGVPAGGSTSVAPSGGGGGREFVRSLTPEQHLKAEQQVTQYSIAIDRAQSVMQRLPLLNSLLDAKKIDLQIDPHQGVIKALINRTLPLSPEEEQLAGDFQTLMEDINLVRGPMGATGFRGPEAFAALQAQRGTLLGRPGVTRTVLTNTLQALRGQRDPLVKQLGLRNSGGRGRGGGGSQINPVDTTPPDSGSTVQEWERDATTGKLVPKKK